MSRVNRLRASRGEFKGAAWREKAPLAFNVLAVRASRPEYSPPAERAHRRLRPKKTRRGRRTGNGHHALNVFGTRLYPFNPGSPSGPRAMPGHYVPRRRRMAA